MHLILPCAVLEATENYNGVPIKDRCVLINSDWERFWLSLACHGSNHVPVECLEVKTVHLRTVVVSATQGAPDQVHILSRHDALVMRNVTGH